MNCFSKLLIAAGFLTATSAIGCASHSMAGHTSHQEMMAQMHEDMAKCLRSGKTTQECHAEMKKNCPMMKDGKCPMMEEMMGKDKMGDGMMGKGMMDQDANKATGSVKKPVEKKKSDKEDHEAHH